MTNIFRSRISASFKARSSSRDSETDNQAVKSVSDAIDTALAQVERERAGLQQRLDDVISRAAIVGGNDADEYMTRTDDRSDMLKSSDADIKQSYARLATLEQHILNFRYLKRELELRFSPREL